MSRIFKIVGISYLPKGSDEIKQRFLNSLAKSAIRQVEKAKELKPIKNLNR